MTAADFSVLAFYTSKVLNENMTHPIVQQELLNKAQTLENFMRVAEAIKEMSPKAIDNLPQSSM